MARAIDQYSGYVGRTVDELPTPALILDLPRCKANIERMGAAMALKPTSLRPHTKIHKSPQLAHLQNESGAVGIGVATVWEAAVMAGTGLDDIFVINTVAGAAKLDTLAELAQTHRILVAVDSLQGASLLDQAARRSESRISILLEIDTGMNRAGIDTVGDAVDLGRRLRQFEHLDLIGITGYEGHCSLTPPEDVRRKKHQIAMDRFMSAATELDNSGQDMTIRSAGGTATWEWTADHPGITEIQAGSYVMMDNFHRDMAPEFEVALTIATTVISTPTGRLIVDAGSKSVGAPALSSIRGADLPNLRFDEEHGIFENHVDRGSLYLLGDVVRLIPGYAPATVNLYDVFHVVEEDLVVDIWPVTPRGPGPQGLEAVPSQHN